MESMYREHPPPPSPRPHARDRLTSMPSLHICGKAVALGAGALGLVEEDDEGGSEAPPPAEGAGDRGGGDGERLPPPPEVAAPAWERDAEGEGEGRSDEGRRDGDGLGGSLDAAAEGVAGADRHGDAEGDGGGALKHWMTLPPTQVPRGMGGESAPSPSCDDGGSVYSGLVEGSIASGTLAVSVAGTGTASMSVAARVVAATAAAAAAMTTGSAAGGGEGARLLVLPAHERLVLIRGPPAVLPTGSVLPGGTAAGGDAVGHGGGALLQRARLHFSPAAVAPPLDMLSPSREEGFRRRRSDAIGAEEDTLRFSIRAPLPVVPVSTLLPPSSPAGLSRAASAGTSVAAAVASLDISTPPPGTLRSPSSSEQLPHAAAAPEAELVEAAGGALPAASAASAAAAAAGAEPAMSDSPAWNLLFVDGGSGRRSRLPAQPMMQQQQRACDDEEDVGGSARCLVCPLTTRSTLRAPLQVSPRLLRWRRCVPPLASAGPRSLRRPTVGPTTRVSPPTACRHRRSRRRTLATSASGAARRALPFSCIRWRRRVGVAAPRQRRAAPPCLVALRLPP